MGFIILSGSIQTYYALYGRGIGIPFLSNDCLIISNIKTIG